MTPEQQWNANRTFLDDAMKRGDDIVLSNNPHLDKARSGSFAKELDYLESKGYRVSCDGTRMIAQGE